MRQDHEPPLAIARYRWRFHHVGIPTKERHPGERYLAGCMMHVQGFETSPYGVEWMRFEAGSTVSELVRTVPHVAFEVDDLEAALEQIGVQAAITSPGAGVRVAMFEDNGAPIELIEFGVHE
jgi:hypothetical protein